LNVQSSGVYKIQVNTTNGCTAVDSVSVQFKLKPQLNLGRDRDTCDASIPLAMTSEPAVTYTWSTGNNGPSLSVNTSGQYVLKAEKDGCQNLDTVRVRTGERPRFSLGRDTSFCGGQKLVLNSIPARNGRYRWSNGANTSSIEVAEAGTYSLSIRQDNCEWADTLVLKQEDCSAFAAYVPNVFSPNSLVNGTFKLFFSPQAQILAYEFLIYDRWGAIVYRSKNLDEAWNGAKNGTPCSQGVYVWRLNVRYQTAPKQEKTSHQAGEVLLLR
jgi:gliding motility-associated-like protein